MLTVNRLQTADDFQALRGEWNALAQAITPRTPFNFPAWHELWWKHFHANLSFGHSEFLAVVLRDASGGLVAVAPLMRVTRPSLRLPLIREIQFFGADPNMTEIRGVICRAENQTEVLLALASYLKKNVKWSWVRWQGIRREFLQAEAPFKDSPRFRWTRELPSYIVDLPQSWELFEKAQSRRVRKKLRTCYKYLERDNVHLDFAAIDDQTQLLPSLDRFLQLHQARTQVRYFDVFSTKHAQAFLQEYMLEVGRRGEARIFQFACEGEVIATRVGFLFGDELYLYHSGNDPAWDKYSIMTTLLAETIKWAIANGVAKLNLSTGKDRSKTRWRPTEVVFSDGVEVAGSFQMGVSRGYDQLRAQMDPGGGLRALLDRMRGRSIASSEEVASADEDAE